MSKAIELLAPAKINLFLHITGQRDDGYHQLQSAFQLIDWYDNIILQPLKSNEITRLIGANGVAAENDLIVRAAQLLKKYTAYPFGAAIALKKNIPMGAGLGGGSSDAASVLIGLNQLWELNLSQSDLMKLGLELGADVPFFLFGQNAFVQGIGERLEAIKLPEDQFLVIFPGQSIATKDVFQAETLTRNHAPITISDFLASHWSDSQFGNDLQPIASKICPEVNRALDWISQHLPNSAKRMSGSGSCVFAAVPNVISTNQIDRMLQKLPSGWVGRLVRGLKQNPAYNSV
jgi:4-diphosphocytidyl-2-C-methyl-D-erythritol kinase